MKVLILNCGSSTLKFQLIEPADGSTDQNRRLARGLVDRIGGPSSYIFESVGSAPEERTVAIGNHEEAVREVAEWLNANPELNGLDAVGHRVVHGGDEYVSSVVIDERVINSLDALCELAPLHNPGGSGDLRPRTR